MKPRVILVRPQLSKNIGSIARVMLNFGFEDLALIQPKEQWLDDKALALAAGAEQILYSAKVCENIAQACADISFLYAFTARSRHLNKETIDIKQFTKSVENNSGNNIGLLFGPESSGLSNEDLVLANSMVYIPTNPEFSSLNLAQSVAIALYEISQYKFQEHNNKRFSTNATIDEINGFLDQLEEILCTSSFLRVEEKRENMLINIKNIFLRINNLSSQEIRTLRGMISALASK